MYGGRKRLLGLESLEGGYKVMQSTADVARQVQRSKLNEERKKEKDYWCKFREKLRNWKVRKKEPNKKCGIKLISNKKIR